MEKAAFKLVRIKDMKKEIKVALITGICSILAGAAGTSLILDLQNSNKNINNNTLIFTNASGQEEVVTAEDYDVVDFLK